MFNLVIEEREFFNRKTRRFIQVPETILELEHSLVSLSKWESRFQKPFLTAEKKTKEEIFAYMLAMVITPGADPDIMYFCSQQNINDIQAYIDSPQSATTFGYMPDRTGPGEIITSELIYYWMVAFTIPFECQFWHLNRLFSLIRICNIKNTKPKKMSRTEMAARNHELNAQRRAQLNSSG